MKYKDPRALEMAVKTAAKSSSMDTNKAIEGFYFDRFLCRVFSEDVPCFVLKGGQSMLARTVDARATRDIDLLSRTLDVDEASKELKRIADINLDDFVKFVYVDCAQIKEQDAYRSGYKVTFQAYLGVTKKKKISVDLVVDQISCEPTVVDPANRLAVGDLQTYDYLLYPVVNAIADKVCAIIELHQGIDSSRVRDLVDLAIIFTSMKVDATKMRKQLELETRLRKLPQIESFTIPSSWSTIRQGEFTKIAKETGLPTALHDLSAAYSFVGSCINLTLDGSQDGREWDPDLQKWV